MKRSQIASDDVKTLIGSAKEKLERACVRKERLYADYRRLKNAGGNILGAGQRSLHSALQQTKNDYRHAKRDFRRAWHEWHLVTSRFRFERLTA